MRELLIEKYEGKILKEYKIFVINSLYGLMEGTAELLEWSIRRDFRIKFNRKDAKIFVKSHSYEPVFQYPNFAMIVTIKIDGEMFVCERDFREEHEYDIRHPDHETDDWFYESDKCYSNCKANELLSLIN